MSLRMLIIRFSVCGVKSTARISFAISRELLDLFDEPGGLRGFLAASISFALAVLDLLGRACAIFLKIFEDLLDLVEVLRVVRIVFLVVREREVDHVLDDLRGPSWRSRDGGSLRERSGSSRAPGRSCPRPARSAWRFDLALAVEELDRPHLAQVHAHGVVRLLDQPGGRRGDLRLDLFPLADFLVLDPIGRASFGSGILSTSSTTSIPTSAKRM